MKTTGEKMKEEEYREQRTIALFFLGLFIGLLIMQLLTPQLAIPPLILRSNGALYPATEEGLRSAIEDINNSKVGGTLLLPNVTFYLHGNYQTSTVVKVGDGYQSAIWDFNNDEDTTAWYVYRAFK